MRNYSPLKRTTHLSSDLQISIEADFLSHNGCIGDIVSAFYPWIQEAKTCIAQKNDTEAIEILLAVLDEIGYRATEGTYLPSMDVASETDDNCLTCAFYINQIVENADQATISLVCSKLQPLTRYDYFSSTCPFKLKEMLENGCIYPFPQNWLPIV